MTTDPRTPIVASVQRAGEAVYQALETVRRARAAQQAALLDGLQSNPFHPGAEAAFQDLKTLSRLALQLEGIEEELRQHFAAAGSLGGAQADQVLEVLSAPQQPRLVIAAPAAVAPAAAPRRKKSVATIHERGDNGQRVLDYLAAQTPAGQTQTPPLTRSAIARGAGVPLGSIGFTLGQLLRAGRLVNDARTGRFEVKR